MHGYIDSFPVPLRLPLPSSVGSSSTASGSKQSKGKGKDTSKAAGGGGGAAGGAVGGQQETYDLVANWTPAELASVQRRVNMASTLGYSTIVFSIQILPTTNPAHITFPTPLFPSLDPRTAPSGTPGLILQLWKMQVIDYTEEAIKSASVKGFYGFSNSTAPLFPSTLSLLSVTPSSLPSFSHTSLTLSSPSPFSPSLLTLDPSLSPRLPFPLKRGLVSSLQRNGMMIELVTRGLMRQDGEGEGGGAAGRRRNWIGGAREVVRAMGGKGVVVSSGAREEGEMRGTEDLINLCSIIGLTPSQAKDALTVNPQRAILRGMALRQSYRGVLSNPSIVTVVEGVEGVEEVSQAGEGGQKGTKRSAMEDEVVVVEVGGEEEKGGKGKGKGKKRKAGEE